MVSFSEPGNIIKVVETFEEGRRLFDELAGREIGAICMKGVAKGSILELWHGDSELLQFAEDATYETQGVLAGDFSFRVRRMPHPTSADTEGKPTIFRGDIGLHLDGFYNQQELPDGSIETTSRTPLLDPMTYPGVSHHFTRQGTTTFLMNQLSKYKVRQLTRNLTRENYGLQDTHDITFPLKGEYVDLEAGDYMALHSYGVYKAPIFVHGTTDSSDNRRSITLNPVLLPDNFTIRDIDMPELRLVPVDYDLEDRELGEPLVVGL